MENVKFKPVSPQTFRAAAQTQQNDNNNISKPVKNGKKLLALGAAAAATIAVAGIAIYAHKRHKLLEEFNKENIIPSNIDIETPKKPSATNAVVQNFNEEVFSLDDTPTVINRYGLFDSKKAQKNIDETIAKLKTKGFIDENLKPIPIENLTKELSEIKDEKLPGGYKRIVGKTKDGFIRSITIDENQNIRHIQDFAENQCRYVTFNKDSQIRAVMNDGIMFHAKDDTVTHFSSFQDGGWECTGGMYDKNNPAKLK